MRLTTRPQIIQGGMGVAVSSWPLASAVARKGQLGVVSGVALDIVMARRLQDGDEGGHVRRAMEQFPVPEVSRRVLRRFFRPDGRPEGGSYAPVPPLTLPVTRRAQELVVVANFAEVYLAREGHDGVIGINYLEKTELATPYAVYGAMLAGVDVVLMGAGLPREIPQLLSALARNEVGEIHVDVVGASTPYTVRLDPADWIGASAPPPARPDFLAIVSSDILAGYLAREELTLPDGFVVEGPTAGGHNAPPRGRLVVDDSGEPVYGPRDDANLEKMAALGLPFWLAGAYGTPERLAEALAAGAAGIQAGSVFALSEESGLTSELRGRAHAALASGTLAVHTHVTASPTGFPFKVARVPGLADSLAGTDRERLCDIGVLRTPYVRSNGRLGYRCAAEPVDVFIAKGGTREETDNVACLCNGLTANIGLPQHRPDGYVEPPLLTLGSDLEGPRRLLTAHPQGWSAGEVVDWLLGLDAQRGNAVNV